ncbi:MAG: hypothetical protein ACFFAJ_03695 [Candidatus Hodarchaeota archaeon]
MTGVSEGTVSKQRKMLADNEEYKRARSGKDSGLPLSSDSMKKIFNLQGLLGAISPDDAIKIL